ncbi:MAG: NUDIX hydrolase [Micromonosporaceae bacterium]
MTTVWTVLDSRIDYDQPHYRVRRDRIQLPDGNEIDYWVSVRPHVAVVFAHTPDDRVLLVEQYKHGAGQVTLELPAGTFPDGEDPILAGARELAEETGYRSAELLELGAMYCDASKNTNLVHILYGHNAQQVCSPRLDANEVAAGLTVTTVARHELSGMIADGRIRAMSSVAAIYRTLAHLEQRS